MQLPVRVQGRESIDHEWVEITRLLNVTPFGAAFTLNRPTERGRLMYLTLAMPRQLRCFDHIEDQYRVWSLVRHTQPLNQTAGARMRFMVGVAFAGKHPPVSFRDDPAKLYEVAASPVEGGLWELYEEAEKSPAHGPGDHRRETRHRMALDVIVELIEEESQKTAREATVTENISRNGASVFTTLNVAKGRFVRLTSSQYKLTLIAAIRARRTASDGITRLHLEFVDRQWPLEEVE